MISRLVVSTIKRTEQMCKLADIAQGIESMEGDDDVIGQVELDYIYDLVNVAYSKAEKLRERTATGGDINPKIVEKQLTFL